MEKSVLILSEMCAYYCKKCSQGSYAVKTIGRLVDSQEWFWYCGEEAALGGIEAIPATKTLHGLAKSFPAFLFDG